MQGYNELRGGAAWLDVSGRGKLRVAGEDLARLLHATITNLDIPVSIGTARLRSLSTRGNCKRVVMAYIVAVR